MSISDKLEQLRRLYKRVDEQIVELKEKTQISCKQGCGECCRRFEPYISTLEAVPIADYLQQNSEQKKAFYRAVAQNIQSWTACPFYNPNEEFHCAIYPIRPTICRLFGFSINRVTGSRQFATCKIIQEEVPAKVKVAQKLTDAGLPIPVYQDVYREVRAIDFYLATDYHPFSRSVEIALENREKIEKGQYLTAAETGKKKHSSVFSSFLRQKLPNPFPV